MYCSAWRVLWWKTKSSVLYKMRTNRNVLHYVLYCMTCTLVKNKKAQYCTKMRMLCVQHKRTALCTVLHDVYSGEKQKAQYCTNANANTVCPKINVLLTATLQRLPLLKPLQIASEVRAQAQDLAHTLLHCSTFGRNGQYCNRHRYCQVSKPIPIRAEVLESRRVLFSSTILFCGVVYCQVSKPIPPRTEVLESKRVLFVVFFCGVVSMQSSWHCVYSILYCHNTEQLALCTLVFVDIARWGHQNQHEQKY